MKMHLDLVMAWLNQAEVTLCKRHPEMQMLILFLPFMTLKGLLIAQSFI